LELFNAAQRWATRECVRKGMSLYMQQNWIW
jgi:phosphopantetheinyl transferase (holo-ACP synthase)